MKGLLFLMSVLTREDKTSRAEIENRCAMENGITVNCPGAIAFLEFINLVRIDNEFIIPTEELNKYGTLQRDQIINHTVKLCMTKMIDEGIFDEDNVGFDPDKGQLSIRRSAFPLSYAAIRNFLTSAGALEKEHNGEICVSDSYETDFSLNLRMHRKKLTLDQLLKKQDEQSRRGLEAEEFVLQLERYRLHNKAYKIKRISDFDVSAGYDIVSYADATSEKYDRFIEVKCYLGKPHFYWSENESDTAQQKGEKYILCLVDYVRMGEPGYQPEFIADPYHVIFSNEHWLVNTASYKIQKV